MGGSNLAQAPLISFGLIEFTAIPGMKPLNCPYNKGHQEHFPGKELLYFFDQTMQMQMQLLTACFCVVTIRGRRLESPQKSMTAG